MHRRFAAVFVLALASALAQAPTSPDDATWNAFRKLPAAARDAALTQLGAHVPEAPLAAALRTLAPTARQPQHERTKAHGLQRAKRTIDFPHDDDALPRRVDYQFGHGVIAPRTGKLAPPPPAKGHADPIPMQQALLGYAPDADLALAVLMQRLDQDAAGDAFAAFLQSWRNGDESFYEALDRTAGTKDSVFFFDAMLGDFTVKFGGHGADRLRGGLQQQHDALHAAFLAYRQYRGFREAIAWSLVLPPDVPLPKRLARYEEKASGGYSLREQVAMVAMTYDDDPEALLAAILRTTPKLPQPVWSGPHDPYPAWNALVAERQATMVERAGSTDRWLAAALEHRGKTAQQWRELAQRLSQAASAQKH